MSFSNQSQSVEKQNQSNRHSAMSRDVTKASTPSSVNLAPSVLSLPPPPPPPLEGGSEDPGNEVEAPCGHSLPRSRLCPEKNAYVPRASSRQPGRPGWLGFRDLGSPLFALQKFRCVCMRRRAHWPVLPRSR